jgi:poly(3-hydroxyalkanoate) synthetase
MMDKLMEMVRGKQAGAGRGFVNPPTVQERKEEAKRKNRESLTVGEREALQEVEDERMRKKIEAMGYAGGGYVKAADGCAQRGKTRGKMV